MQTLTNWIRVLESNGIHSLQELATWFQSRVDATEQDGMSAAETCRQILEEDDLPDEVRVAAINELGLDRMMTTAIIASIRSRPAAEALPTGNANNGPPRCGICLHDEPSDSGIVEWPGGCGHTFHDECMARMYQNSNQERQYCPECYISTDGVPRASPCMRQV
jgi:hypothetical protein